MPSLSNIIGQASRGADLYFVFRFLRLLTMKYESTNAYKLGIIDKKGKALKKSADLETIKEKSSYTMLHRMVFKIRALIEKVPGGRFLSYAAALFLLKEQKDVRIWSDDGYMKSKLLEFLETDWEADAKFLKEEVDNMNKKSFKSFLSENKTIEESQELQAMMALDDAGIDAVINKKGQVVIKKKDLKNAEKAFKKSFKRGGAPELQTEAMNPKDHVKEKDGKFQVISPKGKVVYSSDDKKEAEEWAVKNHDALMKEGIDIQKADMKDVIKDFKTSDAPQFKGKSDKKRKEMAIAAKLSKEENEDDDPVGKSKKKSKKDVINLKPTAESSMKKFKDIMTKLKEKRFNNVEKVEMKEEWIDDEAREVEGRRWKKMSTKDRVKWLTQIKKMADKNDMDQEELDSVLSQYGLTKFDNEKVYDEAQKIKPKWKKMSTVERTKWKDKMDVLAGKAKTSDADVQSIMDDAGLKIKESVEEASGDKEAYQKFFNGALKKFGVKSPSQLKGDKKKEFFDYVDKNWTADHEEETKKEGTMTKKSLKDAVADMKEKKSKVQEALTIGGVEVGEQDFDKQFRLDNAAPNLGMTYADYQAKFKTDGLEGPYQIDGGAYFWDKAATKWFSVETEDYVDGKRNAELNFRYTKQGTAGGGLMHTRRL